MVFAATTFVTAMRDIKVSIAPSAPARWTVAALASAKKGFATVLQDEWAVHVNKKPATKERVRTQEPENMS